MAEAMEAPSAMDGSAVGRCVEKLIALIRVFEFFPVFVRAAVIQATS
jgi:hypothetical protein